MRLRKIPALGKNWWRSTVPFWWMRQKIPRGNWQNYFQNPTLCFFGDWHGPRKIYFLYGEEIPGA